MSEQENRRIGDYEVLAVLGSGGMGQVLKVRNVISDRIEAMKIILPDLAGRQDLADRFLREIKMLAGLHHPNIAGLRTALTVDNQLVMIMEYVEGTTIAARLEKGPLPVADAVNYTSQVLEALSYAHQHNITHRDIKPSNMMLTPEGVVKLMDFGIARSADMSDLTATGAALGSLYYMPPEQVKGEQADARSDIYSVGASLYEMVTGERPFKADSSYSLMAAQVQQTPKPPIEIRANLPATLNEIILLAMAKEPSQRFQTADAFRNALSSVQSAVPDAVANAAKTSTTVAGGAITASFAIPPGSPIANVQAPLTPAVPIPTPVPSVMELSRRQGNSNGKYVALGGLLVVAFLVAAGIYIPRMSKTRAGGDSSRVEQKAIPESTANPQPAAAIAQPAAIPEQPAPAATTGDAGTGAEKPASDPAIPNNTPVTAAGNNETGSTVTHSIREKVKTAGAKMAIPSGENTPQMNAAPADNSAALAELEEQVDQLSSRAVAVNDGLDNLRRQQNAQGLGLRGDVSATQERMKIHVSKAQAAMQDHDLQGAKKYAAQGEAELEQLEKFLGR